MTDQEKCTVAADLFYQHIDQQHKHTPNFVVRDIFNAAFEWALYCDFQRPRCFVEYVANIEHHQALEKV